MLATVDHQLQEGTGFLSHFFNAVKESAESGNSGPHVHTLDHFHSSLEVGDE
jgi:hypothetical protein